MKTPTSSVPYTPESLGLAVFFNGEYREKAELEMDGVRYPDNWIYRFLEELRNIRGGMEAESGEPVGEIRIEVTAEQERNLFRAFGRYRQEEAWMCELRAERVAVGMNARTYRFKWPPALMLKVIWKGD